MVYNAALLRRKGPNSISNFHYHSINVGAAALHYVTGRSFAFSGLLNVTISMIPSYINKTMLQGEGSRDSKNNAGKYTHISKSGRNVM
jgi:hypothetical protein